MGVHNMKKFVRETKNKWKKYSPIQVMVREATSNDPWGPTSSIMQDIAREAESPIAYHEMFIILWKRLTDYAHLKHVIKSLALIEYLLRHGSERFVADVQLRKEVVERLKEYKYYKEGNEVGGDVRRKSAFIMQLLGDPQQLTTERKSAERTRGKIIGFSHEHSNFYASNGKSNSGMRDRDRRGVSFDMRDPSPPRNSPSVQSEDIDSPSEKVTKPKKVVKKKVIRKKGKKRQDSNASTMTKTQDFGFDLMFASSNAIAMDSTAPMQQADFFDTNDEPMSPKMNVMLAPTAEAAPASTSDALFDTMELDARQVQESPQTQDMDLFGQDVIAPRPSSREPSQQDAPKDPWELAARLSDFDDMHLTAADRKARVAKEEKKARRHSMPKLKEMTAAAPENRDSFKELAYAAKPDVYGTPAPFGPNMAQSQALVPVQNGSNWMAPLPPPGMQHPGPYAQQQQYYNGYPQQYGYPQQGYPQQGANTLMW